VTAIANLAKTIFEKMFILCGDPPEQAVGRALIAHLSWLDSTGQLPFSFSPFRRMHPAHPSRLPVVPRRRPPRALSGRMPYTGGTAGARGRDGVSPQAPPSAPIAAPHDRSHLPGRHPPARPSTSPIPAWPNAPLPSQPARNRMPSHTTDSLPHGCNFELSFRPVNQD
jgi:hypothetical protein